MPLRSPSPLPLLNIDPRKEARGDFVLLGAVPPPPLLLLPLLLLLLLLSLPLLFTWGYPDTPA